MSVAVAEKWELSDRWVPRCDHCKRFCKVADSLTVWGGTGYEGLDPHDPEMLCQTCADKLEASLRLGVEKHGIPLTQNRPFWQSPAAWYRVLGIMRGRRKHGLWTPPVRHEKVRTEFSGGFQVWTCCRCGRPEKHPGHTEDAFRVGVRRCWEFQRLSGRWIVSNKVRLWCSCGWSTGLLSRADAEGSVKELSEWQRRRPQATDLADARMRVHQKQVRSDANGGLRNG